MQDHEDNFWKGIAAGSVAYGAGAAAGIALAPIVGTAAAVALPVVAGITVINYFTDVPRQMFYDCSKYLSFGQNISNHELAYTKDFISAASSLKSGISKVCDIDINVKNKMSNYARNPESLCNEEAMTLLALIVCKEPSYTATNDICIDGIKSPLLRKRDEELFNNHLCIDSENYFEGNIDDNKKLAKLFANRLLHYKLGSCVDVDEYEKRFLELLDIPELAPVLKIAILAILGVRKDEALDCLLIIVDPSSESTDAVSLGRDTNSYGSYYKRSIYLGGAREMPETMGTLVHELTHFVAKEVFNNNSNPYSSNDHDSYNEFDKICGDIEKKQGLLSDKLEKVKEVFAYPSKEWHCELIVRVPQVIEMHGNDGYKKLKEECEDLLDYYENKFLPECRSYLLMLSNSTLKTADQWFYLGEDYYYGRNGKTQDYIQSSACYECAIKLDKIHSKSLYSLGIIFERGYGVVKNIPKAREYYNTAIQKSDHYYSKIQILILDNPGFTADQWSCLGEDYYYGRNEKMRDYIRSKACYKQAIKLNQNHSNSLYSLGWIYQYGKGIDQNIPKAREYYNTAIQKSDHYYSKIQILILDNPGFTADKWYSLGNNFYSGMNGRAKDQSISKACYKQAIKLNQNHSNSLYSLGWIYQHGKGAKMNLEKSNKYYKICKGNNDTRNALESFLKSEGVSL